MTALLARLALPQWLRSALGYIGAAALVCLLLWALWARGDRYRDKLAATQAAYDQTVADYRAVAAERKTSDLVNVERVNTEGAAISQETLDGYTKRIADLRADFAERVRRATEANSSGAPRADLPTVPIAASGSDATACQAVFPAQDALIASEQAETLIALQSWVRKAVAIDVNGSP